MRRDATTSSHAKTTRNTLTRPKGTGLLRARATCEMRTQCAHRTLVCWEAAVIGQSHRLVATRPLQAMTGFLAAAPEPGVM